MTYSLYIHQARAEDLLTGGSAVLWWEMRTGKTRAALHAFSRLVDEGRASLLVVVTKMSGKEVWRKEAEEMGLGIPLFKLYGKQQHRHEGEIGLDFCLEHGLPAILVLNWEIADAWLPHLQQLVDRRRFVLVTDEGHEHLLNPKSKRYRAVRDLALLARQVWELTGTLYVNSGMDFYWQFRLLGSEDNPFQYWSAERFGMEVCTVKRNGFRGRVIIDKKTGKPETYKSGLIKRAGGFDFKGLREGAEDWLLERMPAISKVLEDEVREIPQIRRIPYWMDEGDGFAYEDDSQLAEAQRRLIGKKVELTVEHVLELKERPVVVFGWNVAFVERVAEQLKAPMISGSTPERERTAIMRGFQAGQYPILVGNMRSLGTAVDLSAASHFVHGQPYWDAALQRQVEARGRGPKQLAKRIVHHYILVTNSADEYVWDVRLGKGKAMDRLDRAGREVGVA